MLRFILVKLLHMQIVFLFLVQTQIAVQLVQSCWRFATEYVRESECNHQSMVFLDTNKQQLPGIQ